MDAVLKIASNPEKELSGTLEFMGQKLKLNEIERQNEDGKLTFYAMAPGELELEFELTTKGDDISGDVSASDGVTGTVTGKLKKPEQKKAPAPKAECWELTLSPEGMGEQSGLLKVASDEKGQLSGTLEFMGQKLKLKEIERQNEDGKFTFKTTIPGGGPELEFELTTKGNDISGDVSAVMVSLER